MYKKKYFNIEYKHGSFRSKKPILPIFTKVLKNLQVEKFFFTRDLS